MSVKIQASYTRPDTSVVWPYLMSFLSEQDRATLENHIQTDYINTGKVTGPNITGQDGLAAMVEWVFPNSSDQDEWLTDPELNQFRHERAAYIEQTGCTIQVNVIQL